MKLLLVKPKERKWLEMEFPISSAQTLLDSAKSYPRAARMIATSEEDASQLGNAGAMKDIPELTAQKLKERNTSLYPIHAGLKGTILSVQGCQRLTEPAPCAKRTLKSKLESKTAPAKQDSELNLPVEFVSRAPGTAQSMKVILENACAARSAPNLPLQKQLFVPKKQDFICRESRS